MCPDKENVRGDACCKCKLKLTDFERSHLKESIN